MLELESKSESLTGDWDLRPAMRWALAPILLHIVYRTIWQNERTIEWKGEEALRIVEHLQYLSDVISLSIPEEKQERRTMLQGR